MSFSKINIGNPLTGINKRGKFNLSCKNSFSANFGRCIPTYYKEFEAGSTIKVDNVSTEVKMAPLAVPTFGDMKVKHYHCFVPYKTIYHPFDALRSNVSYPFGDQSYIPSSIPTVTPQQIYFSLAAKLQHDQFAENDPLNLTDVYHTSVYVTKNNSLFVYTDINDMLDDFNGLYAQSKINFIPRFAVIKESGDLPDYYFLYGDVGQTLHRSTTEERMYLKNVASPKSYDFAYSEKRGNDTYVWYVKFGMAEKRLFEILIGLDMPHNLLGAINIVPLLAYYYAWFNVFGITKHMNFNDTACAKIISHFHTVRTAPSSAMIGNFMSELLFDTVYTFAPDYYTVHVDNMADNQNETNIHSVSNLVQDSVNVNSSVFGISEEPSDVNTGIVQSMVNSVMRFVNINTVVGQSIADYFRSHGYTVPSEYKDRICFATQHTPIQISKVVSTAETTDASIGDYRGIGLGGSSSGNFNFDCKDYGMYICFSVVIPEVGYFQGCATSAYKTSRFDFYTPEFDSLGYEPTTLKEFNCDYDASRLNHLSIQDIDQTVIGLRPRYLDYKVKNNVINGELRLRSLRNQFSGYTLDRNFGAPSNVPLSSDELRKTDVCGDRYNFNRIFTDGNVFDDHFYIDLKFNVSAYCPYVPCGDSFLNQEQDGSTNIVDKA